MLCVLRLLLDDGGACGGGGAGGSVPPQLLQHLPVPQEHPVQLLLPLLRGASGDGHRRTIHAQVAEDTGLERVQPQGPVTVTVRVSVTERVHMPPPVRPALSQAEAESEGSQAEQNAPTHGHGRVAEAWLTHRMCVCVSVCGVCVCAGEYK